MPFLSTPFAWLAVGAAVAWWCLRGTGFGVGVLLASGVAFFAWKPWTGGLSVANAAPLVVFTAVTVLTAFGVRRIAAVPPGERARASTAPIVLLVLLLTAFKAADAPWSAGTALHFALPLGVSYYVLRAVAALVEASRGALPGARPLDVAGFLGFAPLLTVGPIERASAFLRECRSTPSASGSLALARQGIGRIVEGLFKLWVLCSILEPYAAPVARMATGPGAAPPHWSALYAYALHLYLNFSAASDLAIGVSRLFGVKIMENFDLPYARPNLAEFWRAWHVSLSTWLRDFLYFPIGKRLPRAVAPVVAPLLVMALCGLWHGLTLPFLAWGLLHGAGLAVHQRWLAVRRRSEAADRFCESSAGRTLGAILTVHFVALTWVFFAAPDLGTATSHLGGLFRAGSGAMTWLPIGAAAVAIWSFVPSLRDRLRRLASDPTPSITADLASLWRTHLGVVLGIVLVARFLMGRTSPGGAFVYQGF